MISKFSNILEQLEPVFKKGVHLFPMKLKIAYVALNYLQLARRLPLKAKSKSFKNSFLVSIHTHNIRPLAINLVMVLFFEQNLVMVLELIVKKYSKMCSSTDPLLLVTQPACFDILNQNEQGQSP